MAVRCVRAGKSTQAPAAPTLANPRFKLVMHVLSDSARASTRHPASLKFLLPAISNLVRARSLVLMRCSSCGGRSGCVSAALPPIARAAAEKLKGAAELDAAAAAKPKGAAELDAAAAKPKGAAELEAAAAKPKGEAELDEAAAKPKGAAQLEAAAAKPKGAAELINWLGFNA